MPEPRGDELTTIIDYRTSAGNDVAWFPNHTDSYVNWSLGDDTWYAPAVDERLEVSYSESGLAETWYNPWGYDPGLVGEIDPDKGLVIDNSSGTLTVATGGGTVTGYNFNQFIDSNYDDVFLGSDADETFMVRRGGSDQISGGAGDDVFQFKPTYHSHAAEDRHLITDYEAGERIQIYEVGFDGSDLASQLSVRYDDELDRTSISVTTETYTGEDLISISGEFSAVRSMNLIYDHGNLLPALELELVYNTAPVAVDDSITVPEDAGLTNIVVLDNDTDVDNDALTLSAVSIDDPTMGTVAINADGTTIDFTPAADVNGPVSVTYTTADGNGGTDKGTLSIVVTPAADARSRSVTISRSIRTVARRHWTCWPTTSMSTATH